MHPKLGPFLTVLMIESRRGRRWLSLGGAAVAIIGGYLLVA